LLTVELPLHWIRTAISLAETLAMPGEHCAGAFLIEIELVLARFNDASWKRSGWSMRKIKLVDISVGASGTKWCSGLLRRKRSALAQPTEKGSSGN
jgi:hypothetical protein